MSIFSLFKSQEPTPPKTPMQQRLLTKVETLTEALPPLVVGLLNQYLPLLIDNLGDDDDKIIDMLGTVRAMLDEIEHGEVPIHESGDISG